MGSVGLGVNLMGWVGLIKMDPCPCLGDHQHGSVTPLVCSSPQSCYACYFFVAKINFFSFCGITHRYTDRMFGIFASDIDECAPGGIASSCNESAGGVCVGHLPDLKFQCTCQPGYRLDSTGVACEGLHRSVNQNNQSILLYCAQKRLPESWPT